MALLGGALMHLECRVTTSHAAGDHMIVVAEVLSITLPDDVGPAWSFRGSYGEHPHDRPVRADLLGG